MLERRKPLDLLFPLKGSAKSRVSDDQIEKITTLDRLRAGVMLAKDAVKAVSVTAMEALREGVAFIGLVDKNELVDPFENLDAPIWSEKPPQEFSKKMIIKINVILFIFYVLKDPLIKYPIIPIVINMSATLNVNQ